MQISCVWFGLVTTGIN